MKFPSARPSRIPTPEAERFPARPALARTEASSHIRSVNCAADGKQPPKPALVCLSHLRWDFVFQRPQHLLTRFARRQPVYYIEEPIFDDGPPRLAVSCREHGLRVVTPYLTAPPSEAALHLTLRGLVDRLFVEHGITEHVLWFYTPMALPFTHHLRPGLVVYDCMDELSAFAGAPPVMREREAQLMSWADLVFTGGQSLYEAKRRRHPQVHAFPSSIDQRHFATARTITRDPSDQERLARPRIGFYGVVDERFDAGLLAGLARARPTWQFIIIGPVVKIDPDSLPRRDNIHYLGRKDYGELPGYLAGWDVAMLPFAHNESTRFISPTKTPEYLSAGRPVVSTSIADVVRPYGELGLVHIADSVEAFAAAIEAAFRDVGDARWRRAVDLFLEGNSWDRTWDSMHALMLQAAISKGHPADAVVPIG
jgi:UDP-galactopyranose mutase